MKRSKAYNNALSNIEKDKLYSLQEAIEIVQKSSSTKFDATVEGVIRLGIDPKKSDQLVRGTISLPNGTGKTATVIVFAEGENAKKAVDAGADEVGSDDLITKIQGGWTKFDSAIATPDLMRKIAPVARILGPRGLMPNPRTGTVTTDVEKAIKEIKGGKIEFRVDKNGNLHFIVGKASFTPKALAENFQAVFDEIVRQKPTTSKGKYILKVSVSATMTPGVQIDL